MNHGRSLRTRLIAGTLIHSAGVAAASAAARQTVATVMPVGVDRVKERARVGVVHYRVFGGGEAIPGCGAEWGTTSGTPARVTCGECRRLRGW